VDCVTAAPGALADEQEAVPAQLHEDHVFVIALGALLADTPFVRELTRELEGMELTLTAPPP
jgi:hypothetical protein